MEDLKTDALLADAPAAGDNMVPPAALGPESPAAGADAAGKPLDPLDELADLDFLLEDIEDKIAPLALSMACDF